MPEKLSEPTPIGAIDAGSALRGYFGIMDLWKASNGEARTILGSPSLSTFFAWKRGDQARPSCFLRRIGYVAGIFKALQILFGSYPRGPLDPNAQQGLWLDRLHSNE